MQNNSTSTAANTMTLKVRHVLIYLYYEPVDEDNNNDDNHVR